MATPDITRSAFDPKKHYDSVIMQQGRVILDDDWNENEAIRLEDDRRQLVDIIGPAGSPDDGFRIENPEIDLTKKQINFDILGGTFYLGGLRLELESEKIKKIGGKEYHYQAYREQTDWLQGPDDVADPQAAAVPESDRWDLVYLEAFQQPVGAVEDGELFEVALGGADTSMRMRTLQRVHLVHISDQIGNCAEYWQDLKKQWKTEKRGDLIQTHELVPDKTLTVYYIQNKSTTNLCKPAIQGGYLGTENQAIQVQLVDKNRNTFTWGFDNASPLYRVHLEINRKTVKLITKPKDKEHWPSSGQIVEILPWSANLPNNEKISEIQGHLSRVKKSYDSISQELTLETVIPQNVFDQWLASAGQDPSKPNLSDFYCFLRVWNRGQGDTSDPEIKFQNNQKKDLGNTGIKVKISGSDFNPGDYWVIAARPETPKKFVPWGLEKSFQPHGIRRFYAPLALIHWKFNGGNFDQAEIIDCRPKFTPLTKLRTCCTYRVGDGKNSFGDFDAIQDAVDNLPPTGGEICILPGYHSANVKISDRLNITIKGCGRRSLIIPQATSSTAPIFEIIDSQSIKLEQMQLITVEGTAIAVTAKKPNLLQDISIGHNRILAFKHAIDINQGSYIHIYHNKIRMLDKVGGRVAIFLAADDSLLERNEISVVQPEAKQKSTPPSGTATPAPPDPADPCAKPKEFYQNPYHVEYYSNQLFGIYVGGWNTLNPFKAFGGIQIAGGSDRVKIAHNIIKGGWGSGITLGSSLGQTNPADVLAFIYDIDIEHNEISDMGLSGIGIPLLNQIFLNLLPNNHPLISLAKSFGVLSGFVVNLNIQNNHIFHCLQDAFDSKNPILSQVAIRLLALQRGEGGISLGLCENLRICNNIIEENGRNHIDPVCGIFVSYTGQVEISHNHILNNGLLDTDAGINLIPGIRGGVVLRQATSIELFSKLSELISGVDNIFELNVRLVAVMGGYAARIHDNIIRQPMGQALCIAAFGPVSILNNQFNTDFANFSNWQVPHLSWLDLLAGTVFVMNLGGFKSRGLQEEAASPSFLPNGNVLMSNNQTRLGSANFSLSSQSIATCDDLGFHNNQSEVLVASSKTFQVNTLLLARTLRATNNCFQEQLM